jgi:hypothetical protein
LSSKGLLKLSIFIAKGGLADEVDEKLLQAAFLPFGDIVEVQMPLDYATGILKMEIMNSFQFLNSLLFIVNR